MVRFGLAFVCGVSLAAGCGKAEDESPGTGGAWSGGSSTTGGARVTGGSVGTGGVAGSAGAVSSGGSGAVSGNGSGGVVVSGGSVSVAGSGGSVSVAGRGGSSGAAGAAGEAGGGAGPTDGGAAGSAGANDGGVAGMGGGAGGAGAGEGCPPALPLKCGDRFDHSTLVQGRPNTWGLYSATQRAESGRETIYRFSTATDCEVHVQLSNLTTDLDLLRVPTCDSISGDKASSTPIDLQTVETIGWSNAAGKAYYVVVDGYAGAEGSYTLAVDCACD